MQNTTPTIGQPIEIDGITVAGEVVAKIEVRFVEALIETGGTVNDAMPVFIERCVTDAEAMGWPTSTIHGMATVAGAVVGRMIATVAEQRGA